MPAEGPRPGPGARAAALARSTAQRTRAGAQSLRGASRTLLDSIPTEARRELRGSLWRLRKVRTPQQAAAAFEAEIAVLLQVVTPMLAEHPLPVHRTGSARAVVAGGAALAATGEQLEAVVAVFSEGVAVPATLPIALSAIFLSLALELYVATSLRVHDLRAAGAVVDPQAVAAEVGWAMAGASGRPVRAAMGRKLAARLSARMLSRWGRGLVPLAGAVYSGWDAQRTIAAISDLGVPGPVRPARAANRVKPALPEAEGTGDVGA
jgi:hypothetical protein